jgi:hypothetical protein
LGRIFLKTMTLPLAARQGWRSLFKNGNIWQRGRKMGGEPPITGKKRKAGGPLKHLGRAHQLAGRTWLWLSVPGRRWGVSSIPEARIFNESNGGGGISGGLKRDEFAKNRLKRHPGESRGPEHVEITLFRLSPEGRKSLFFDFLRVHQD